MKKEQVTRDFKLADSVLKQKADELIALIDRDSTEFTDRGYNAAKKTELTAARDTAESFPSDEQLEAIKMDLTEQKDAARKALEKSMRSIFKMAENVFGLYSAKYKEFGNAGISQLSDAEVVRIAKMMSVTVEKYLPQLADEGLTFDKINTLITQREALDVAIDAQAQGVSDRDVAAEGRIEALNKLYQLLTKYAGTGKDIFYETNEAKYNDYIIYDTPSGLPEMPPTDPV
ncbi:hypothetical protein PGH12_18220 [Chryseobacterium wangxinyae]|uniref:hypothetical protein n=1 Tax=Chryseobacterium sp. CY350 TaxID=2997336 RepID=UPI00226FC919|nr:hypothetical protein [Chryseobacterium sp. CY350]MCY0977610.1 hypothetical protein [Chryseobacterium sp. CY350]WBZ95381.1 hypothetical protein PGH12_18220 [Chryseobacterium sp. CY350]